MNTCTKRTSSSICSGSSRFLILIEEFPRILDCFVNIVTRTTIQGSLASMLTSIRKRTKSIDAHCALPSILHFAVQELKSMEEVASPTGLESNTSVQSKNPGNLIFDEEPRQLLFNLIFQHLGLSKSKRRSTADVCSRSYDA